MSLKNKVLAVLEPTMVLDKFAFKAYGEGKGGLATTRDAGMVAPLVIINGYRFNPDDIKFLEISLENSIPKINLTLIDTASKFAIDFLPRDGDVISIRIAARAKDTYKDIRIDFDIETVESPLRSNIDQGTANARYSFTGRMKIPGLYADQCKSYGVGTTREHLENIATDLKLGLATNVTTTDDSSNLIVPYNTMFDTLDDLVKHSYIGDKSFQTYCIDPYYYINFVDLNTLLDAEDTFEKSFAAMDIDFNEISSNVNDGTNKMESTLLISTHQRLQGTNMHISRYSVKNNSGKKLKENGYKRIIQFFEDDEGLAEFDIEPITSTRLKDIETPLKGRLDEPGRYRQEVKYKYLGRRDSDPNEPNSHLNREFAAIHNMQNIAELEKLQLEVELSTINHAIHLFQRIPVFIFNETDDQIVADTAVKTVKEDKNFETSPKGESDLKLNSNKTPLNDFLSGFYVVGKIKYTYKQADGVVKQVLTLLKREWPNRINNIE